MWKKRERERGGVACRRVEGISGINRKFYPGKAEGSKVFTLVLVTLALGTNFSCFFSVFFFFIKGFEFYFGSKGKIVTTQSPLGDKYEMSKGRKFVRAREEMIPYYSLGLSRETISRSKSVSKNEKFMTFSNARQEVMSQTKHLNLLETLK